LESFNQTACTKDIPICKDYLVGSNIPNTLSLLETINETNQYYFLLDNCAGVPVSIILSYTFLNPGGEQLSLGLIPLPKLYIAFIVLWSIVSIVWCFNWLYYRQQNVKLHKFISVIPFTSIMRSAFSFVLFRTFSVYGYLSYTLFVLFVVALVVWHFTFYATLMLIAKGWCTVNDKLPTTTYLLIFMIAAAEGLVFFVEYFYVAVLLLSFVIDIVIFVIVFRSTAQSVDQLKRINSTTEVANTNETGTQTDHQVHIRERKILMLRYFLWLTLAYIFLSFVVGAIFKLIVDFTTIYNWLNFLYYEILDIIFFICVAIAFRLRSHNLYFLLSDDATDPPQRTNSNVQQQTETTNNETEMTSNITPS